MQKLEALEEIIGYSFKNKELLNRALTHSSFANEEDPGYDNERLEFLGDAVLDMVISNKLFKELKDSREGDLTKLRAAVVCEKSLAKISKDKGINNYLRLG
ncbi:MAG: ribonuclease III, partial [Firmicutes bacterium]|nr:ribonuclease III [Bacillota bacterium]